MSKAEEPVAEAGPPAPSKPLRDAKAARKESYSESRSPRAVRGYAVSGLAPLTAPECESAPASALRPPSPSPPSPKMTRAILPRSATELSAHASRLGLSRQTFSSSQSLSLSTSFSGSSASENRKAGDAFKGNSRSDYKIEENERRESEKASWYSLADVRTSAEKIEIACLLRWVGRAVRLDPDELAALTLQDIEGLWALLMSTLSLPSLSISEFAERRSLGVLEVKSKREDGVGTQGDEREKQGESEVRNELKQRESADLIWQASEANEGEGELSFHVRYFWFRH